MADNEKIQFQNLKNKQAKAVEKPKKDKKTPTKKDKIEDKIEKKEDIQKQNRIEDKEKTSEILKEEKEETKKEEDKDEKKEGEKETKKEGEKKEAKKPSIPKKSEAIVKGESLPISLKHSKAVARFIKFKQIDEAIYLLGRVLKKKLAVPIKGEIAHRKGKKLNGKGMTSGKYPINTSKCFIKLLKTLKGNGIVNGMEIEKTIIVEVIVNKAPDQMRRFGRTKFKRTHVLMKAKERESGGKK